MEKQLNIFGETTTRKSKVVNVASVPQRSPFRYPGGKTWLIPTVRKWLRQEKGAEQLIEPFAGGGIVSLTAAFENLAKQITMTELDDEVAAVWKTILSDDNEWLANKILKFDLTQKNISDEYTNPNKEIKDLAFCTILKNRTSHGGIITKGAGMMKNGENGKGISSRWYAQTLAKRIRAIDYIKNKIEFHQTDAFKVIEENRNDKGAFFFIDPPYMKAGRRLYTHFEIDHERLFYLTSKIEGKYMLTYDNNDSVKNLARKYRLPFKTVPMKTTHNLKKNEILICNDFDWY